MKLHRDFTNVFNFILDNLIPPYVRDVKWFSSPLFWLLFGEKAKLFLKFKEEVHTLSTEEILNYYKELADVHIQRETDLNKKSIEYILENIEGAKVLDIASGRGFLASKITEELKCEVYGVDFMIDDELMNSANPKFIEGDITQIPFPDNYFDTVICAHTLEHVYSIQQAINELRRVCGNKLIVVLPKQREFRYTFDLHIHFFPYKFSVLNTFNNANGYCFNQNNDWIYIENISD